MYPSPWILEKILEKSIPIVLNSDAHMPHEINLGFDIALELLKEIGFQEISNYNGTRWINTDINEISAKNKVAIPINNHWTK